MPASSPKVNREIPDEEIAAAFKMMNQKVSALTAQQMHMGLLMEFFMMKVLEATGADGEVLMDIDMNEFPAWADERTQEIRDEAQAALDAKRKAAEEAGVKGPGSLHINELDLDDKE